MDFGPPETAVSWTIRSNLGREVEIRVYSTPEGNRRRWHFGFPKKLVSPLCPLLACTPYWGDAHWAERDGFWLWHTAIVSDSPELNAAVRERLTNELRFSLQALNQCSKFLHG